MFTKFKTLFVSMLLLTGVTSLHAQYQHLPVIPDNVFDVIKIGAIPDGKTVNTEFIQKALDQAGANGGKVLIPPGTYLCGPLSMHSKTELIISKGAVLRLINDVGTYPVINNHYGNFIEVSDGSSDIKISGGGTIDGQGRIWWEKYDAKQLTIRRPQMLFAGNATRIEITGVTFLDPPNTHISLKDASDVFIHGIKISAPANSHNTDGINISARNCTIDDCDISTGDDNIAVNFGGKMSGVPECENILITNCHFGYGHGLSVGSYTSGGLKHLLVSKCVFDGTTCGVRIKTARGRGGVVEDLIYSDLTMKNVRAPFYITEYYPHEPTNPESDAPAQAGEHIPVYRNVVFKNITAFGSDEALKLWGLPESPLQNFRFENVVVSAKKGGIISNATQIVFINSHFSISAGQMPLIIRAEVNGL